MEGTRPRVDLADPESLSRLSSREISQVFHEIEISTVYTSEYAERAAGGVLERATADGSESLMMRAELVLAEVAFRRGQGEAGARTFRAAHRWATANDDAYVLARSHRELNLLFATVGDEVMCLDHALKAVELLGPDAPDLIRADHLLGLALIQARTGDGENFRRTSSEAEELVVRAHHPDMHLRLVNNLSYGEYRLGDHLAAQHHAERLVDLHDRYAVPMPAFHRDTAARAYLEVGGFEDAEVILEEMLDGARDFDIDDVRTPEGIAEVLCTLGEVQRRGGRFDAAATSFQECRRVAEDGRFDGVLRRLILEEARLNAARGCFRQAYEQLEAYLLAAEVSQGEARDARMRMLQVVFEKDEARRAGEQFLEMALHDPLTGLVNRRYVDQTLPELLESADLTVVSAAFIDLDHFKRINDTLSHEVGDEVLRQLSRQLNAAAAGTAGGFAARMGGEEFLLVLPGLSSDEAYAVASRLLESLRAHDWSGLTGDLPVRASVGLATAGPGIDQTRLLAAADRYVYAAKHRGRDQVVDGPA